MHRSKNGDASAAHAQTLFVTTRWSVVLRVQDKTSPESREALETLCQTYWYPVYALVRGSGYPPQDAQDLTQEFYVRLLAKDYLRVVTPDKGRFRTFLRMALKRFLANEWERLHAQKRGGQATHISGNNRTDLRITGAMNDTLSSKCPRCGAEMSAAAAVSVCPRCAAEFLQAAPTAMPGDTDRRARPFTPPTPAELGPLFPQLEILELIGQGGMGAVYRARQKELDRIVALKILPPSIGQEASFAERFMREARALAKLNHPNIVTLFEFGRADGMFFFLMEFVDGVTLRQLLKSGQVSPREALAIVPSICDALQFAHDQGIVHRDIKLIQPP